MLLFASCAVLTLISGVFVLRPLFRKPGNGPEAGIELETESDRLSARKAVVYANLMDLSLEYQMGRLSEEDYRQLEAGYKAEASAILEELERFKGAEPSGKSVSRDRKSKKGKSVPSESGPAAEPRCPSCGAPLIPGKKFCADCGHKL
jgi:hypothetical protein